MNASQILVQFCSAVIGFFFFQNAEAMSWRKYQKDDPVISQGRIVISSHYDLQGRTYEVPANTVIEFDGGSIQNGVVKGNNTRFENLQPDCLLCSFEGSFADVDVNADVFGLHPQGDGTVKRTPNQQAAFERVNTLLPCVERFSIRFSPGYYGFGGGGEIPQGKGQKARMWFGRYAFYLYDYEKESALKELEIAGDGASFVNVFPYYIGSWTKDSKGKMIPFYEWNQNDTGKVKASYATNAGGFLYVNTDNQLNVRLHGFIVDMNRDIFLYGGYQGYTQDQCGLTLTTRGDIQIDQITSKNNVTDGIMIISRIVNNEEVFPNIVSVTNSVLQNNMRVGIALSVGKENLIENCDFFSNGRIYLVNDSYKFESPFSDIDIEPIIERPFANVVIRNCRFRESNRHAIVSSRQNINSLVVSSCSAINTLPRIEYASLAGKNGKDVLSIVESKIAPLFLNAFAVERLSLDKITLTDVSLGYGCIMYAPTKKDKGHDGEFYVKKMVRKRATAKEIRINSGGTYTMERLNKRANHNERIINLLTLSANLQNYQYKSGAWSLVSPSTNGFGYGGWDLEDVVYDIKDGYGIGGAAAWNKGVVNVKRLRLNILEERTAMPVFNSLHSNGKNDGVDEKSGANIEVLEINDPLGSFDKDVKEPSFKKSVKRCLHVN